MAQAQKLQSVAAELQSFFELIKELDSKLLIPTLVWAGVSADRRFKLSEMNSLIKEDPQNGTRDQISRQDF